MREPHPENLVHWKKGQSGNPKGRPRKLFPKLEPWRDDKGRVMKPEQVLKQLDEFLAMADKETIKAIANDDAVPVYVRRRCQRLTGSSKEFAEEAQEIRERIIGKVKNTNETSVDLTGSLEPGMITFVHHDEPGDK